LGRALLTVLGVTLGVAVLLGIRKANEASLRGFRAGLEMTSGKAALEISAPPLGVAAPPLEGAAAELAAAAANRSGLLMLRLPQRRKPGRDPSGSAPRWG
jgi:hypothetical protein